MYVMATVARYGECIDVVSCQDVVECRACGATTAFCREACGQTLA